MSNPIVQEFMVKEQKIHQYLDENGLDALLIGTQANFAWISGGGRSNVLITSEGSDALVIITHDSKTLIAYNMDGDRNQDEEMGGLGFDLVMTHWNEKSREEIALDLLNEKKYLSDIPLKGAICNGKEFYNLIYPLTDWEIERYEVIASDAEMILKMVVDKVKPGMTEIEIERMIVAEYGLKGFVSTVVLVGSDERLLKYRHPIPSPKIIEKTLLFVLCPRKYGLHIPITRMVCFGGVLETETERRFEAASTIAAHCIAKSKPGEKFSEILYMQKSLYKELGYENEWNNHFQGGITGYIPNDSTLCLDPNAVVQDSQTFNWFITITGVNTEDTYLSGKNEILTRSGMWPLKSYKIEGTEIQLPAVLYK